MQTLGKLIAGVCAILFVATGVIALLFFNVERKAFSSATYKQAFENQKLYERMPAILAGALSTSIAGNQNAGAYLKAFSAADWEASISSILPPEELKALTDDALDATFDYINGKTDSAVVSVLPIKRHLTGESSVEAVKQILRAQLACTTEQLTQIAIGVLTGKDFILCNPPEEALGLITPLIESQLQFVTSTFPNEVTLISNARSGTPDDPRLRLNKARLIMKVTPILPLAFLIGIIIFAVRNLTGWLNWWGGPLLMTGASSLVIAVLGSPVIGFIVERFMQTQGAGFMPPIFLSTIRETASAVTGQILRPMVIEGLILALLGLVMVVLAAFMKKRETATTGVR